MATDQIINLDNVLETYALSKLGSDFVIDKIDTSKVTVTQRSVLYHGSQDWYKNIVAHEEFIDNDDNVKRTVPFKQKVSLPSQAAWTIVKAYTSSKFLPVNIQLDFPVSHSEAPPLSVVFDTAKLGEQVRKAVQSTVADDVTESITLQPYSCMHACALIRTCKLNNVSFTTDVQLSGAIRIIGQKKGKKWNKNELTVGIADALGQKEALGFEVHENKDDPEGPARHVSFRFEGMCSGEVGVEAMLHVRDMDSAV